MKLCLVEDDLTLGQVLQSALKDAGHEVVWVRQAAAALRVISESIFDAVLLDIGLPDADGFEVVRSLRKAKNTIPILIITARDGLDDRLNGLNLGADDFLVKPFAMSELLARIQAVMRRVTGYNELGGAVWRIRDLELDDQRMRVTRAESEISLSRTEFALLHTLMRSSDRVLTRSELESRALPQSEGQSLDMHISNLRRKIGDGYIRTMRGVGFMIEK